MNEDQVKGRVKEAEGKVMEIAGRIIGNKSLEEKGKAIKAVGKIQAGNGDQQSELRKGS